MKKTIIILVLIVSITITQAQITLPQPSPTIAVTQNVGLSKIELSYSRPGMKERSVFGGLVPYGELWRTGANQATKFTFSDDVIIEGTEVPAGQYALFSIPGKDEWTVIFNKNVQQSGVASYEENLDAVRFTVPANTVDYTRESFTIDFTNFRNDGVTVLIGWENTEVTFDITVPYKEKVEASIEATLNPEVNPFDYYQAAMYYLDQGENLETALSYVDKALESYGSRNVYWMHHQRANILAALGRYKEAIKVAEKSMELAEEAGNPDYVRLNTNSISKWKKM